MSGAPAPPPPAAAEVFADRLPEAERFVALLAGPGVERGLIGPRETGRLWDRHVLNCAVVAELIPIGASVADVGSGAGLPGIPIALARPDLRITLVEPMARRTEFLQETVALLGLQEQIGVRRTRAGDPAAGVGYDVIVVRAVAPIVRLVPLVQPMLRVGGLLLALKGRTVDQELAELTGVSAKIHRVGGQFLDPPTTVVAIRRPVPRGARANTPARSQEVR